MILLVSTLLRKLKQCEKESPVQQETHSDSRAGFKSSYKSKLFGNEAEANSKLKLKTRFWFYLTPPSPPASDMTVRSWTFHENMIWHVELSLWYIGPMTSLNVNVCVVCRNINCQHFILSLNPSGCCDVTVFPDLTNHSGEHSVIHNQQKLCPELQKTTPNIW